MTQKRLTNVAHSVRQRLVDRSRAEGRTFQALAQLYAMERFLYRLAASPVAERFVLKGGLMTMTWAAEYARLTRDIDLLGRGASSVEEISQAIAMVLVADVHDDGLRFDPSTVQGERITVETAYVGVRVRFSGELGGMAIRMQVDVGFGDAVVPPPKWPVDSGSPHPSASRSPSDTRSPAGRHPFRRSFQPRCRPPSPPWVTSRHSGPRSFESRA